MHEYPQEIIKIVGKLFWSVPEESKIKIAPEAIVEQTLNYGNAQDVRALIAWLGIDRTAEIFFRQISRERNNYRPRTCRYFTAYFNRHAHKSIKPSAI